MYIIAIAWIYVVLMMSITEESVIAGMMTMALYGILPLSIILYIMQTPQRKRRRAAMQVASPPEPGAPSEPEASVVAPPSADAPAGHIHRND